MQFLGFGDGRNGYLHITSDTTESPIDSSFSGSAGATSATIATGLSISQGDVVKVWKTRGITTTTIGTWELLQVDSYNSGTGSITFTTPLVNSYQDSGADQSQLRVVPQYTGIKIDSGVTYTCKSWNGDTGADFAAMVSGNVEINGTLQLSGADGTCSTPGVGATTGGFRGGNARQGSNNLVAYCGEGSEGDRTTQTSNRGTGGGAASSGPPNGNASAAGGGHASAGQNGIRKEGNGILGTGGTTSGLADLTIMTLGGAGGGASTDNTGATGGGGSTGCCAWIFCAGRIFGTGSILSNGGDGGNGDYGSGGGATGGSIFCKCMELDLTSLTITALAGQGGEYPQAGGTAAGGDSSEGRLRFETCKITGTGTVSPTASTQEGGFSFCSFGGQLY